MTNRLRFKLIDTRELMERLIYFENLSDMMSVFGSSDSNLNIIENMMNVSVIVRGSEVKATRLILSKSTYLIHARTNSLATQSLYPL